MRPALFAALLALTATACLRAQEPGETETSPAEATESGVLVDEAAEESHAPAKRAPRSKPKAAKPDDLKPRLAEIGKVYKAQMSFAGQELDGWKAFWTKMRDERGLFEMRLAKQREGFVDSLRSLDPRDHYQSLSDFETLQNNAMRSFEENQSAKIREFILERENKVREFGAAQESERARLAQTSSDAWEEEKSRLNLQGLTPPEKPAKDKQAKKKN